ncbi:hypothetical protein [Geodermatophilus sp. CPCC 205761]|uniref:hypothetical protein n=1 Tax=Geodermatophilus sp. CPCC 205761 TaxID=2936597 RepID=UPI003EEA1B8A
MTANEGAAPSGKVAAPIEIPTAAKQLRLIKGSAEDPPGTYSSAGLNASAVVRARKRWSVRGCQCEPCLLRRAADRERRRVKALREQQDVSR